MLTSRSSWSVLALTVFCFRLGAVGTGAPGNADLSSLLSSTTVATNVSVAPAGSYVDELAVDGDSEQALAYSSWVTVALLYESPLGKAEFKELATALRHSLADSLELCRAAVHVADLRAVQVEFDVDPVPRRDRPDHAASLMHRIRSWVRSEAGGARGKQHVNMTQVKAAYEVRVFPEMRVGGAEVARRIDQLQIFSRFTELSHLLAHTVARASPDLVGSVVLDDLGYASRRVAARPPLSAEDASSCVEEGLLLDARSSHQFFMGVAMALVLLITCTGSTIFTLKHPSAVPSRLNPLSS